MMNLLLYLQEVDRPIIFSSISSRESQKKFSCLSEAPIIEPQAQKYAIEPQTIVADTPTFNGEPSLITPEPQQYVHEPLGFTRN